MISAESLRDPDNGRPPMRYGAGIAIVARTTKNASDSRQRDAE